MLPVFDPKLIANHAAEPLCNLALIVPWFAVLNLRVDAVGNTVFSSLLQIVRLIFYHWLFRDNQDFAIKRNFVLIGDLFSLSCPDGLKCFHVFGYLKRTQI